MGAWILLLLLIALGFLSARAVWPAPRAWSAADPLRLAAAPALGMGIVSGIYFVLRIVLLQPPSGVIGAVAAAFALVAAVAWSRARHAGPDIPAPRGSAPLWLWILFGVAALMAFLTYIMLHGAAPHGEWDAWSIWNLRARFLFRAQEFVSPFSAAIEWTHPDYPLLVPSVIALLWHAGGAESTLITGVAGLLFVVSTIAVPLFAVRLLRGPGLAVLCALSILSATSLVRIGASLYADVPLAAFIVIAGSFLVYGLETESAGPVFLAGLAAGFAAWTKNEGLLFCISLAAAHLLSVSGMPDFRRRLRTLLPLLAGILTVLAIVGYFKLRMAPANDLVNASNRAVLSVRMVDFNRYWVTFWAFAGEFLTFGNVLVPPVIVFSVWLALVRLRSAVAGTALLPLVAVSIQLAGYFVVYVATPNDLDWQLNTSLPRLLLHVWPLAVTGIFLISRDIFDTAPKPAAPVARSK